MDTTLEPDLSKIKNAEIFALSVYNIDQAIKNNSTSSLTSKLPDRLHHQVSVFSELPVSYNI